MKEVIAIASADWHIHRFRNFNEGNRRLLNCLDVMRVIGGECERFGVPLLFAGDWYHTPEHVENETHSRAIKCYKTYIDRKNTRTYAVSGNHDLSERNAVDHESSSHLDAYRVFDGFHLLNCNSGVTSDFYVWGIPYYNSDRDLKIKVDSLREDAARFKKRTPDRLNILMLHSDAPGAKTCEGIEVKETEHIPEDLDNFFKEWDLVIMGHIHKPQKIGRKVIMCGSPIHQNLGDEGVEMGYWLIFNDASTKFIPLNNYPKFIRGDAKDNFNYWVAPDAILADEEVEVGEFNINKKRSKLARLYLTKKGIKSKAKRRALINILNQAE